MSKGRHRNKNRYLPPRRPLPTKPKISTMHTVSIDRIVIDDPKGPYAVVRNAPGVSRYHKDVEWYERDKEEKLRVAGEQLGDVLDKGGAAVARGYGSFLPWPSVCEMPDFPWRVP